MNDEHYAYILVEHEKWWNTRLNQSRKNLNTQAFVRRGKVGPKEATTLLFYVKLPVGEIKGYADFVERINGTPEELWRTHGAETVFESQDGYNNFVEGRDKVTFIRFRNLQELEKPVAWKDVAAALGIKKMPNGGRYINRETLNTLITRKLEIHV